MSVRFSSPAESYATTAQVIAATSVSAVVSPFTSKVAVSSPNIWSPSVSLLNGLSSGSGANVNSGVTALNGSLIAPSALTAGYATKGFNLSKPSNTVDGYNCATLSGHSVKIHAAWASTITGVKMRGIFGRASNTLVAPATLAVKGYGWEFNFATNTMSIIAHDGTTLTTTAVTWTPVSSRNYEITSLSDGTGTIYLYVDGVLLGTSTGGATTSVPDQSWWQVEIQNEITATSQVSISYQNPKVFTTNG